MKKSICIEMIYTDADFYDRFKLAARDGFEYIEFWSWDDKDIERIKDISKKEGLKIAAFSGDKSYNLVDVSEQSLYLDFLKKSISAAEFLDCKNLVIHSNALGENGKVLCSYDDIPYKKRISDMTATIKILKSIVSELDITLVLEPLNILVDHVGNTLYKTETTVNLLREVDSRNIRMLYDIYHMQISEGNIIDSITNNLEWIGHIHVADVPGRYEPGTGELNYVNIASALKNIGYDKIVGFELLPKTSTDGAVNSIKRF